MASKVSKMLVHLVISAKAWESVAFSGLLERSVRLAHSSSMESSTMLVENRLVSRESSWLRVLDRVGIFALSE